MENKEQIQSDIKKSAENTENLLNSQKELVEAVKSLTGSIENGFKSSKEAEESEVIKSLKTEISDLKETVKFSKEGNSSKKESATFNEETQKSLNKFKENFTSRKMVEFEEKEVEALKAVVTYDNSLVGSPMQETYGGEIDYKRTSINPIFNLVDKSRSVEGSSDGSLAFDWFDESFVKMAMANELDPAEKAKIIQRGKVKFFLKAYKAYFLVSDRMLLSPELSNPTMNKMFTAFERNLQRQIAKDILTGKNAQGGVQGILVKALENDTLINKSVTAAANKFTQKDLIMQASSLKPSYLQNAVFLVDRNALYDIFTEEGQDGHYKLEMIDYANGIARIKTPEYSLPIIGFQTYNTAKFSDSDIDSYASLVDGTNVDSGYVQGGTNNKKVVSILADFKSAYTVCKGSIERAGYDDGIKAILEGSGWAGKVSYYGGGVKTQEAISILSIKN